MLGHHDKDLAVLDARTGTRLTTWGPPAGSTERGHALCVEPGGAVLILDTAAGRVLRVGKDGVVASSPPLGEGLGEAALPE